MNRLELHFKGSVNKTLLTNYIWRRREGFINQRCYLKSFWLGQLSGTIYQDVQNTGENEFCKSKIKCSVLSRITLNCQGAISRS
jgi:hypothetical protein